MFDVKRTKKQVGRRIRQKHWKNIEEVSKKQQQPQQLQQATARYSIITK